MTTSARTLDPTGRTLAGCLHLLMAALLGLAAGRAVATAAPGAGPIVAAAVICGLVYLCGLLTPAVRTSRRAAVMWLAGVGAAWLVLLVVTPDGVWVAFPLYFLELHLLARRSGLFAVVATAVAAIIGYAAHQNAFHLAMAIGPALGAAVAVAVVRGYEALYRESERRRRLIEELTAVRADLARAQHSAGVHAERERLAREIHDTLAQGLSSIQLLLRAAERALPGSPGTAEHYVEQARHTAVDNLAEARRFVADLTPPALDGTTVADALERLCSTTSARHSCTVRFRLTGVPVPLPTAYEVVLLRIAQSALANTIRHAGADTAEISLDYTADQVTVEVVDDGTGFDADRLPAATGDSGFGLAAMRSRVLALGGDFHIESGADRGTRLTARLDVPPGHPEAGARS
ncbi:sensor histidine kinase [Nocardia sp. NBC_00416]|uniref:sensor histidine kinase n=1 Tax=Nocardia sp. NBC_00416 TaxID=2975991 RepID=UPI002E1D9457